MGLQELISVQFGNPHGALGKLAGFIMAHRSSNLERILWAISLLDAQPDDRILEIGFGPGMGIRLLNKLAPRGIVYGIDRSFLMVNEATRANNKAIESGHVRLIAGSVSEIPPFDQLLDKVLDVNSFQFWNNPAADLRLIKGAMRPGGSIAIAHQPRNPGAVEQDAIDSGKQIGEALSNSGFVDIRVELKQMKPVPTICVIAKNPA